MSSPASTSPMLDATVELAAGTYRLGEAGSERAQQVRPGLEPILVEVPGRALARPKHEVALEEGVLDE